MAASGHASTAPHPCCIGLYFPFFRHPFPDVNPRGFHVGLFHVVITWSNLAPQHTPVCSQVSSHAAVADNNMSEKKVWYRKHQSASLQTLLGMPYWSFCHFENPSIQNPILLFATSLFWNPEVIFHLLLLLLLPLSPFWSSHSNSTSDPLFSKEQRWCFFLLRPTEE